MYPITTLLLAAWLADFEEKSKDAEQKKKNEFFAWEPKEETEKKDR